MILHVFRHEKKKNSNFEPPTVVSADLPPKPKEDYERNYHIAKLRFGLLLFDINDAIREGDGHRLMNLYKFALLLYKGYGSTKYAYTTMLLLTKVISVLPSEKAESLISNRFCKSHCKPGCNIPLDLHLKHLNNLLKGCL